MSLIVLLSLEALRGSSRILTSRSCWTFGIGDHSSPPVLSFPPYPPWGVGYSGCPL